MWNDFKEFALKGNILDLAVGVVIGGAFGAIVTSLVDNIIMPLVGILLGGVNFSDLQVGKGDSAIMYGAFIQSIVDFFIIAFSIFIALRFIMKFKKKEEAPVVDPQEELLKEIRDLLKEQQK